ncbi:MAG: hypothetical protein LH645_10220 [Actinomycetia bacterium]|nr:hypothetical protein [Actinomycetes bacterium]
MAGFLNKAKAVAQQALDEAKKGVETGQTKLDEAQAKREAAKLLAILGAAFYADQRAGGPRTDVDDALSAVDQYVAVNGTTGFPTEEESAPPPMPPPPAPTPAPTPPPVPPAPPGPPAQGGGTSYDMPPNS